MIQANELRIGNYVSVFTDGDSPYQIDRKNLSWILSSEWTIKKEIGADAVIYPVPLTPEILTEWCGFKVIEDGFEVEVFRQTYRLHLDVQEMVGKPPQETWILLWEQDVGCGFEFLQFVYSLHQLQNLIYFTNTAEQELEIKIPVKA